MHGDKRSLCRISGNPYRKSTIIPVLQMRKQSLRWVHELSGLFTCGVWWSLRPLLWERMAAHSTDTCLFAWAAVTKDR